ncbi:hypothetical protein CMI37_10660 [Candidatus Pacearchaeota archaeon]|nr:hypothetical protein [Candidatus Pacearchaeota archaeon]|tara:strand:- start:2718 stop:3536 length:819 start_codon:yes stop_codon:yes gene_type:complete
MKDIEGTHITVNCWNEWFEHPALMILEHYDNKEYDNTVFVLGSYCFHTYSNLKELYKGKRIIIYQMEQLFNGPDEHWVNVEAILGNLEKVDKTSGDEIWDMCLINKAFMGEYGIEVDKVAPFKFCKSLEELDSSIEPEIDVLFYGNLNKRRSKILADLSYYFYFKNVSLCWLAGLDMDTQKKYIEKSKIILNLHHTDTFNRQEQTRIFYPLINKKCVISESSTKNYFGDAIVETPSLPSTIENLLELDRYKEQAEKGYNLFKKSSKYAMECA